jgi:hypothetical protein
MQTYGYADDWALSNAPLIRRAHSSAFVRRSVAIRRKQDLSG